ncbi:MAG: hypothetical protein AAGJ54_13320 [Planctomycetota bacterium]
MSEANPVDRKRFPVGTTLIVAGLLCLAAIAAHTAYAIYAGTKQTLATIDSADPTTQTLNPSTYIITRPESVSTSRSATVTATNATFTPEPNEGWIEFNGERNLYLGTLTTANSNPITLTVSTDAYPVHIRRDPMTHVEATLIRAFVLGTIAAALTATGAFIAINRINDKQRRQRQAFQALVE